MVLTNISAYRVVSFLRKGMLQRKDLAMMALGCLLVGGAGISAAATDTFLFDNWLTPFGLNKFSDDYETTQDGIDYDIALKQRSTSTLLNWHPTGGGFRFSGGLLFNRYDIEFEGLAAADDFEHGDRTYGDEGWLNTPVDFRQTAPYLGVGWSNSIARDSSWRFSVDVGVTFQGESDVEPYANDPLLPAGTTFDLTTDFHF